MWCTRGSSTCLWQCQIQCPSCLSLSLFLLLYSIYTAQYNIISSVVLYRVPGSPFFTRALPEKQQQKRKKRYGYISWCFCCCLLSTGSIQSSFLIYYDYTQRNNLHFFFPSDSRAFPFFFFWEEKTWPFSRRPDYNCDAKSFYRFQSNCRSSLFLKVLGGPEMCCI